jgi:hypothetical protein
MLNVSGLIAKMPCERSKLVREFTPLTWDYFKNEGSYKNDDPKLENN